MKNWNKHFDEKAFAVIKADDFISLKYVKKEIYNFSVRELNLKTINMNKFFNSFHELKIDNLKLNQYRLKLINFLTKNKIFKKKLYESFEKSITKILGEDIAVQKSLNVVIHQPRNLDFSPIHRDGPENSPYEIVLWLPLTDCYKTKSIYLLNKTLTENNLKYLDTKKKKYQILLNKKLKKYGKLPKVKFGEAVVFWSCLLHSVPENIENETRWTFNLSLKNLFTPYGKKGFLDYFEILKTSGLSNFGIDFEKKNY